MFLTDVFVSPHWKNIVLLAFALLIILAGFLSRSEPEVFVRKHASQDLILAPKKSFELEQCLVRESQRLKKLQTKYEFLEMLHQKWDGPVSIESLKMQHDEWEVTVFIGVQHSPSDLPQWFAATCDLIQQRRCVADRGCWYVCYIL